LTGISTIRAGNVIGGGDWAEDRIVPDCIRSLTSRKSISIRNPDSVRPWQFVLEPLFGILLLASRMSKNPNEYSQAWNFGPLISNKALTVRELVNQIISEWGEGEWKNTSDSNVLHESNLLILDSTKAADFLGWHPAYSVKEAVHETISWYRAYFEGKIDMKELTLNQIQNYLRKVNLMKNSVK
jgi:CDP-glucose 4,6-dehydratase